MSDLILLEQLQDYLIAEGVGQLPEADPSTVTPSIWTMGRQGAAMPRTADEAWLENVTITLNDPQLVGPPGLAAYLVDTFVSVTARTRNAAEGTLVLRQIQGLLHPIGSAPAGKLNWMMGELRVLYSGVWRAEAALPPIDNGLTYDRVAYYRFTCSRSDLAA